MQKSTVMDIAPKKAVNTTVKEIDKLAELLKKRARTSADPFGRITFVPDNDLDRGLAWTLELLRAKKRKKEIARYS